MTVCDCMYVVPPTGSESPPVLSMEERSVRVDMSTDDVSGRRYVTEPMLLLRTFNFLPGMATPETSSSDLKLLMAYNTTSR